jgi:putative iron-dependent peroxidase
MAERVDNYHSEEPDSNPEDEMTTSDAMPQPVTADITRYAIFMVLSYNPGPGNRDSVRSAGGDLAALVRSVGRRVPEAKLSCVAGFGSDVWEPLFGLPRPAELHRFREVVGGKHKAVSTSGDIFFHIRAEQMDLCFELATQIMVRLGTAVSPVDEVHGFRYFDLRGLLGFVDGTENPSGQTATGFTIVGDEDPGFAGGSYVIVQKYLHDLTAWNAVKTEEQEGFMGRTKLSDIELDDSVKPSYAHNALTTIVEDGKEVKVLRDNMAFGSAGEGEFGTYFIAYSRTPHITELMLENMFIGKPQGNYDRLLDFSRAVTGGLFFVPSSGFLDALGPP